MKKYIDDNSWLRGDRFSPPLAISVQTNNVLTFEMQFHAFETRFSDYMTFSMQDLIILIISICELTDGK